MSVFAFDTGAFGRASLPTRVAASRAPGRCLDIPRRGHRSHFDLDDGAPVEKMPWLHWITLRVGEAMLALQAAALGWFLWCAARELVATAASLVS